MNITTPAQQQTTQQKQEQQSLLALPLSMNLLLPCIRQFHSSVGLEIICTSCGLKKQPRNVSYKFYYMRDGIQYIVCNLYNHTNIFSVFKIQHTQVHI